MMPSLPLTVGLIFVVTQWIFTSAELIYTIPVGNNLTITCNTDQELIGGIGYQWWCLDQPVSGGDTYCVDVDSLNLKNVISVKDDPIHTLTFINPGVDNSGTYRCVNEKAKLEFRAYPKPEVVLTPATIPPTTEPINDGSFCVDKQVDRIVSKHKRGDYFKVECPAEMNELDCPWHFTPDGSTECRNLCISSDRFLKVIDRSTTLEFVDSQETHTGNYTCGKKYLTFRLVVEDKEVKSDQVRVIKDPHGGITLTIVIIIAVVGGLFLIALVVVVVIVLVCLCKKGIICTGSDQNQAPPGNGNKKNKDEDEIDGGDPAAVPLNEIQPGKRLGKCEQLGKEVKDEFYTAEPVSGAPGYTLADVGIGNDTGKISEPKRRIRHAATPLTPDEDSDPKEHEAMKTISSSDIKPSDQLYGGPQTSVSSVQNRSDSADEEAIVIVYNH